MNDPRIGEGQPEEPEQLEIPGRLVGHPQRLRPDSAQLCAIVFGRLGKRARLDSANLGSDPAAEPVAPEIQFAAGADGGMR